MKKKTGTLRPTTVNHSLLYVVFRDRLIAPLERKYKGVAIELNATVIHFTEVGLPRRR